MNFANFGLLIRHCTDLGKAYKPAAPLKLTALKKLEEQVQGTIEQTKERTQDHIKTLQEYSRLAHDIRQRTKGIMRALSTPVPPPENKPGQIREPTGNNAEATPAISNEERIAWLKQRNQMPSFFEEVSRLWQFYFPPTQSAGDNTQRSRLSAHQSSTVQVTALSDLADKLEAHEGYAPEDEAIKPAALRVLATEMEQKNTAITAAAEARDKAAAQQEQAFYDPEKGLVAVANAVKEYIASAFEPDSEAARIAAVLLFKNMKEGTAPVPA